jgi:hypothetical protein
MNIKIAMILTVVGIMTLCIVATKPLANQAFALHQSCLITLKADPGSGSLATGESIDQKLSGTLTCRATTTHTGLGGATIGFSTSVAGLSGLIHSPSATTDSSGNYHGDIITQAGKSYLIKANYAGDSDHLPAATIKIIHIKEKNSGRFTQP